MIVSCFQESEQKIRPLSFVLIRLYINPPLFLSTLLIIIFEGGRYMRLFLFLALFIAVIIIVFTAQNQTEITLTFLNWELSKPLPVMLAVPFIAGVIAGIALVVPAWMKKSKAVKTHRKRIQELEDKLTNISEETREEEGEAKAEPEPVEQVTNLSDTQDEFK